MTAPTQSPPPGSLRSERLLGWGRAFATRSAVFQPRDGQEARQVLRSGTSVIPRGGGRSFGDAALNDRCGVICSARLRDCAFCFDSDTGAIRASAAWTQREILEQTCSRGWALPAIPGSREITLGGKVAADAHGKNHYAAGSTIRHVRSMRVLTADGSIVECSRESESAIFWATAGGLGLTGIVLSMDMQLRAIPSTTIESEMHGFEGVDELMEVMERHKDRAEYLLGWADGRFRPGGLLRGVVAVGRHVEPDGLVDPWALPDLKTYRLPFSNPMPGAGWLAAHVLNTAIACKFVAGRVERKCINQFFFPQDAIANWNVAFGGRGFVEYHCCVPLAASRAALTEICDFFRRESILCSLVAFKRFGPAVDEAPLSFPLEGYSMAVDVPLRRHVLEKLRTLDEILVRHGGRVNPVKDSRLTPDMLRRMYPRLEDWLKVRRNVDPRRVFSSNMSRRLELDG